MCYISQVSFDYREKERERENNQRLDEVRLLIVSHLLLFRSLIQIILEQVLEP